MLKNGIGEKTKTSHDPGIRIIDFIDKVDYIVLSTGFDNKLKVKIDTIKYIEYKKKYTML